MDKHTLLPSPRGCQWYCLVCAKKKSDASKKWLCKINLCSARGSLASPAAPANVEGAWLALPRLWDVLSEDKESKCSAKPRTEAQNRPVQNATGPPAGTQLDCHPPLPACQQHFHLVYPNSSSKRMKCLVFNMGLPIVVLVFQNVRRDSTRYLKHSCAWQSQNWFSPHPWSLE